MFWGGRSIVRATMTTSLRKAIGLGLATLAVAMYVWRVATPSPVPVPPLPAREGLALAIVYDTSGSMADPVANAAGGSEPKYRIARRAADSIFDQLDAYVGGAAPGTVREVEAELLVMNTLRARRAISMSPFRSSDFKDRIANLPRPGGGTPLGRAVRMAAEDVLASPLSRKHVLVVTDGENTEGPAPEAVLGELLEAGGGGGMGIQVHFVAFDVAAKVFDPVKNLGATVAGAADEAQLKDQLEYILQKKILLENEEPPLK